MAKAPSLRGLGFADDQSGTRPGLQHCLEAALAQSDALIDAVIEGLDVTVSRAHGSLVGAEAKPVTKLAIEHMLAQRTQMRATFAARLREAMYGGIKSQAQAQPLLRFDDLKLLEEDKLDENIESAWALQEIEMAVEDVLPTLDALVSTLLGWITVQPQLNPLRPEVFVRALRAAMLEQIEDNDVRGSLMTPAAGRLGTVLRKLYRELSDWLKSQGIEPAGLPGIGLKAGEGLAKGANAAVGVGASVARTILTLDRLRKLLSGELDIPPPAGGQDFLYTVPASLDAIQDMKMVEAMVQRLAKRKKDEAAGGKPAAPKRQLDSKQIGKQLGEEVIRVMVESLTQDERLLLPVRKMLESLEPVLLRLAQTEPRFFSEKQHPARALLDRITSRSLGFATERDEGFARFSRTAEQAVSALRELQTITAANFAQVLKILEDAWAREDKAQKVSRDEAAKALLHAEQRNLLAQRLAGEFRQRVDADAASEVPEFVVDFLCGPWAQAAAESQLTNTGGAPETFVTLVDELIWSVQPRIARRNRTRLLELVPRLLTTLRQGLQLVSYPPEMTIKVFDGLIGLHEAALEGGKAPKPQPSAASLDLLTDGSDDAPVSVLPEPTAGGIEVLEQPWEPSQLTAGAGFLEADAVMPLDFSSPAPSGAPAGPTPVTAGELTHGTWAELMLEGKWVRAQLTWVSPHRTLFMFTSAGGKAHSMSRRSLERLRSQGILRVVSDGHLVDNALDVVAQVALRNSLDKPKTR